MVIKRALGMLELRTAVLRSTGNIYSTVLFGKEILQIGNLKLN